MKIISTNKELSFLLDIGLTNLNTDSERENISKRLANEIKEIGANRDIFIKIMNGQAVAMIQIIYKNADNDPDLANGVDVAHIHDLEVRKDLHGHGIGKQCVQDLETFAIGKSVRVLTLGVDSTNTKAMKLYHNLGYRIFKEEEGRVPEEKLYLMKKVLDKN